MDSIQVKVPCTVKAKLTEKLKKRIIDELEDSLQKVDLELQQMGIEEKRIVSEAAQQDIQRAQAARQHFAIERQKRMDFKEQAQAKLEETKKLARQFCRRLARRAFSERQQHELAMVVNVFDVENALANEDLAQGLEALRKIRQRYHAHFAPKAVRCTRLAYDDAPVSHGSQRPCRPRRGLRRS